MTRLSGRAAKLACPMLAPEPICNPAPLHRLSQIIRLWQKSVAGASVKAATSGCLWRRLSTGVVEALTNHSMVKYGSCNLHSGKEGIR